MNRWKPVIPLAGFLGLMLASPVRSQDEITYYDQAKKTETKISGTIQSETAGRIVIKPVSAPAKEISAMDVVEVVYHVPALLKPDYRSALNAEGRGEKAAKETERKKELASALTRYQDLLAKATEKTVKRHFEFKVAKIMAQQAEDDAQGIETALDKLTKFKSDHPESWQFSAATHWLAKLLLEKKDKDFDGAEKAYEELAKMTTLTEEMRQDCHVKIAQILVKARKFDAAETKLKDLVKSVPAESPQGLRIQIALAETQAATGKAEAAAAALNGIIARNTDPDIRAVAHNTLGDCYRIANRPKDAIYEYLWVDVIYHQNRAEHAKALYYAVKLFKELKDEKNAKEYRSMLEGPQFAGLEYQKLLANEK